MLPFEDLMQIDLAAKIVLNGIKQNKRFTVHWDCDADGICSGTIITKALRDYGITANVIYNFGKIHGIKEYPLQKIVDTTDILIVVDSASEHYEQQKFLEKNGVKVIIIDHHPANRSEYCMIINSQFNGYKNNQLSGSGLVFKFIKYLDYLTGNLHTNCYADLAVTGLVSDMVSMGEDSPENRYIAHIGLETQSIPISAIIDGYDFNGNSISYSIAPLLNSAVRNGNMELAVKLMMSDSLGDARRIVKQLKSIKAEQDEKVAQIIDSSIFQIKNNMTEDSRVISVFVNEKDSSGLVGNIIANKYYMPTIVLHDDEKLDEYKGSIRGFGVNSFKDIIWKTGLAWVGGHDNAAGITVKKDKYESLIQKLNKVLKDVEFTSIQNADISLEAEEVTYDLIENITRISKISGQNFKPISVVIESVEVNNLTPLKPNHLKFDYNGVEFVMWKAGDKIKDFQSSPGIYRTMDVMGSLSISDFRGIKARQFVISDYKDSREELAFLRD
jgi:single-stranded-DNA-specific exonuclease